MPPLIIMLEEAHQWLTERDGGGQDLAKDGHCGQDYCWGSREGASVLPVPDHWEWHTVAVWTCQQACWRGSNEGSGAWSEQAVSVCMEQY